MMRSTGHAGVELRSDLALYGLLHSAEELEAVRTASLEAGATAAVVTKHHALGGAGAVELAEAVVKACSRPKPDFKFLYDVDLPIKVSLPSPQLRVMIDVAAFATASYFPHWLQLSSRSQRYCLMMQISALSSVYSMLMYVTAGPQ